MDRLSIKDLREDEIRGKTALVRVDFNVPIEDGRTITDDLRITSVLDTIRYLIHAGARLVLMSHLDKPGGKFDKKHSLRAVSQRLAELLEQNVVFVEYPLDRDAIDRIRNLTDENVFLIDNVRFYPGEEGNDDEFSSRLAELGDFFVNDGFGAAHRAHASTVGVTRHLSPCAAGFLMVRELEALEKALNRPERPFVAIIGGAKAKDKIKVIRNLFGKVDTLLIGGAMANTFFAALGYPIGASYYDVNSVGLAHSLVQEAKQTETELILPQDCVIAEKKETRAPNRTIGVNEIPPGWMALDIGTLTRQTYRDKILGAKTVVWNGPMGVFEHEPFNEGTVEIARIVAETTAQGAFTLVGGGESVAAIRAAGLQDDISHVSTGGGACLQYLAGTDLPGVTALTARDRNRSGGEQ